MERAKSKAVWLIDLPTFPKGVVALSLYAVAAALDAVFEPEVIDLNFTTQADFFRSRTAPPALCGLKVSAQNLPHAIAFTQAMQARFPGTPVLWGGELPTLLPETCLQHADCIVQGAFEPVAPQLCADLLAGSLAKSYGQATAIPMDQLRPPRLSLVPHPDRYPRFMGLPMESARGCTYKCTFCMVHTMQPGYAFKTAEQLQAELKHYEGRFLNLVDYNFGVDEDHVLRLAAAIQNSGVLGWMGEMCLESLDNDRILQALADSRCRMVYCGLEALDDIGLKSINKARTNQIQNYERIIRKVQAHGIQIGAGLILGLEGASPAGFQKMRAFYERMGILYIKLTFLTYNPGTKVKESMRKKGSYVTEDVAHYDGNHLTFLPEGVDREMLFQETEKFIRQFYSLSCIHRRSRQAKGGWLARLEFILFNHCYRDVYRQWLREGILRDEARHQALIARPFQPSWQLRMADAALQWVRKRRLKD